MIINHIVIILYQRQGTGKFVSRLEGHYDGSWDRDLKHGRGMMKYKNGNTYEGFWEYNQVRSTYNSLITVLRHMASISNWN